MDNNTNFSQSNFNTLLFSKSYVVNLNRGDLSNKEDRHEEPKMSDNFNSLVEPYFLSKEPQK